MSTLYDTDFYRWAMDQAEALREASRLNLNTPKALDWENLAEEIESLGRSDARELYSRHVQLLLHLLKWVHQPSKRTRSWRSTMREQRQRITLLLKESPGLKPGEAEAFARAYADARELAADQTGLPVSAFPEACPITIEQAMDPDFPPPDDRPVPRRRK
jgi:uncharacterized membrane protein YccC